MDAVDRFDIILDVTDREKLYDYVESREYTRPSNRKWDLSVFKGKGSLKNVEEDDENGQMRVHLMDSAISDKRCLEKKTGMEDQGAKGKRDYMSFDGEDQDGALLPKRIIPLYKPGEIIKGRVELALNQPVAAERLVVGFLGRAFVSVRVYTNRGYYDDEKEEKFTEEKILLWQHLDGKVDDVSDKFSLLSTNEPVPRGKELSVGNHTYNFEFAIPTAVPQSTPPLVISTHNKGYVMYRIKAKIDKGKLLARGNILTHKGLWIDKSVDIGDYPKSLEPGTVEEVHETFFKTGTITVKAKIPKTGILRGESINLTLEVYNQANSDIAQVAAFIRLSGRAKTGDRKLSSSNKINIKSTKQIKGPIQARANEVYQMVLPWDFSESSSDGKLLPVGDLDDCRLLDINYEVSVKLTRKGLHKNMEVSIPIVVGNKNKMAAGTN